MLFFIYIIFFYTRAFDRYVSIMCRCGASATFCTTERGGGESVVIVLKQLCLFQTLYTTFNDSHNNAGK
jgi:hypothetical protein